MTLRYHLRGYTRSHRTIAAGDHDECASLHQAVEYRPDLDFQTALRQLYRRCVGGAYERPVLRQHHADQRQGVHLDRALQRAGHRSGAGCGACGQGGLGQDLHHRSLQRVAQDRRPHRAESGTARLRRDLGQRQTGARNAQRRCAVVRGSLPLFRWCHSRAGRRHFRDRQRYHRLSLPRTVGRGRADHSVEFSAADGVLETGTGAGHAATAW